ncbi:MAG: proprotein convertase P-domain-containing protein, partial [Candidatus Parabeggiatoa sp.]|nr:proprotein convertase P-domain-containing protein [Candidatus Parabeggiatoa sp.]
MFSKTRRSLFILFLVNTSFLLVTPVVLASTSHSVCQTPSLTIPNNDSTGVSDTLTISDSGKITDINLIIDANHQHLGELIFRLEHEDITVTLLEKPGMSDTVPKGCYGKNLDNLTVDDEGTHSIQNECHSYDPGYEKTFSYYPKDSLTAFDNQNIAGDWTLTVSDNYDFNSKEGSLNKWCIKYERVSKAGFSSTPDPGTTLVFNKQAIVDEGEVAHYSFDISESANIEDLLIYSADISGIHGGDFKLIVPEPSVFPLTIQLGSTQTFTIACKPSEGGERTATFTLKTNVTAFPTITYPLSCTGLAASYS